MEKKLRVFKGNREQDIYDVCKEKRPIDINGELTGEDSPDSTFDWFSYHYGDHDEELRRRAREIVRQITDDPVEHRMADLILGYGYKEEEVAKSLNISPGRVERFMTKMEDWKRKGCKANMKPRGTDERKCDLLIVDDEPSFRLLLEKYFKQEIPGIKIELAKDGEEGLHLALKFRPRIVWTCIKMPRTNGLELIKLIKENPDIQDAKVIVFSAYASKEMKNQVLGLGADAFLHKGDYNQLEEGAKIVTNFLK